MKYCKTCALLNKQQNGCLLSGQPKNPETDYCSNYLTYLPHCDFCNKPMLPQQTLLEEINGEWKAMCPNCNAAMKTCQTCLLADECLFETDPNPLPKVVTKTIRQGNAVMQAQVKNPERESAICPSCKCWNEECGCMKNFNVGCNKKVNVFSSENSSENKENS